MQQLNPIWQTISNIWKPPPNLSVSQWSDSYRKLSSESSAEAGQWRTGQGLRLRPARAVLEGSPGQMRNCPGTRQKGLRQTPDRERARLGSREATRRTREPSLIFFCYPLNFPPTSPSYPLTGWSAPPAGLWFKACNAYTLTRQGIFLSAVAARGKRNASGRLTITPAHRANRAEPP